MIWLTVLYLLFIVAVCAAYMVLAARLRARVARAQNYVEGVSSMARRIRLNDERNIEMHMVRVARTETGELVVLTDVTDMLLPGWTLLYPRSAPPTWEPGPAPEAKLVTLKEWGASRFDKSYRG